MMILPLKFWLGVAVAVLCGAVLGFERQVRGKPAGIRTNILICVGTYVFVFLSVFAGGENTDPTRVLGQIVTGVGFLGAGVIIAREGHVRGLTSAADIWVLASIGALVGFGLYYSAIVLAFVTVVILTSVVYLERFVYKLHSRNQSDIENSKEKEE